MLFESVDIPEALLDAQLQGRLVVFCGAGISAPAPSSMPTFTELVDEIAQEAGDAPLPDEQPDQFLGRIEQERRFPVHRTVAARCGSADSKPCALRQAVTNLFRSGDPLRIVTTNFDRHLSTIARTRDEVSLEYTAPALPVGDSFTGIAYVHGEVGGDANNLVVTDADFGRAYLTRGYARRFLLDCFRENVVLFVGYSHNDRIMQYLARGLPPTVPGGPARFALASLKERANWKLLGIELISYDPDLDSSEPHAALRKTLERWAEITQRDYDHHRRAIEAIVSRGPDVDRESQEYLRRMIQDPVTAAFFCEAADNLVWLKWLEDEEVFRAIFGTQGPRGDVQTRLCRWLSLHAVKAPADAQATVARMGGRLGTELWMNVVRELLRQRPSAEVLLGWLPILMRSAPEPRLDVLSYLLSECRPVDDDVLAFVMLLGFLTEPIALSKPEMWAEEGEQRHVIELVVRGEDYWIREALSEAVYPRIEHYATDLLAIATRNLERGHDLLQAGGRANEGWDELSFRRPAIEQHAQNEGGQPEWFDLLVDAARAAIDWAIENDADLANAYMRIWHSSRTPLLRRLEVYAIGNAPWLDADARLMRLVEDGRLFASELRHEVFVALADAYPHASDVGREFVIRRIDEGVPPDMYAEDSDLRDRVLFDLISWLLAASSEDEELKRRLAELSARHADFLPRPHPDMTHWVEVGGWVPPPSPKSKDAFLETSPDDEELLSILQLTADEDEDWPPGSRRESLLASLRAAAIQNPDWSLGLARSMADRGIWMSDVWRALVEVWGEAELSEQQWRLALQVVAAERQRIDSDYAIARMLEDQIRHSPPRLPLTLLPAAEQLADDVLASARASQPDPPWEEADWIQRAVNETAGRITMFLLHALSLRQKGEVGVPLPAEYERRFDAIVSGDTYADGLGRAVLGGQLHYLFARYRTWATERLLPLLDWTGDPEKALQAWQGFLTTGRLYPELAPALVPLYASAWLHLDQLGGLKPAFMTHLAYAALVSPESPLAEGWLERFLRECTDEDISTWTRATGQQLGAMPSAGRVEAWRLWVESYWRLRASSMRRPVSPDEGRELVGWIPDLTDVFEQAADCACLLPEVGASGDFYHRFAESKVFLTHPAASARLLRHVLAGERREAPFWACEDAISVATAIAGTGEALADDLSAMKNELLRLGCRDASAIPSGG